MKHEKVVFDCGATKSGKCSILLFSGKCSRTNPIMANIDCYIDLDKLYGISGIYPYNFNTLGITTELDAIPEVYDIGMNWIGSGLLEWCRNNLFTEVSGDHKYEVIINQKGTIVWGAASFTFAEVGIFSSV